MCLSVLFSWLLHIISHQRHEFKAKLRYTDEAQIRPKHEYILVQHHVKTHHDVVILMMNNPVATGLALPKLII